MSTTVVTEIAEDIEHLDIPTTVRISDLMRHGAKHTEQAFGWGSERQACALSAAALSAAALHIVETD